LKSQINVTPSKTINMALGDKWPFTLAITNPLAGNTYGSHTYKIYAGNGSEVTSNFSGGSSHSEGTITFGVIAYAEGHYTCEFVVTSSETLPDAATADTFIVELGLRVKD